MRTCPMSCRCSAAPQIRKAIDHALDTRLHRLDSKVQQQPDRVVSESQVRVDLLNVNRCDRFDCFDLDQHACIDDQVGSIRTFDPDALVDERYRLLGFERNTCLRQITSQTGEICTFKEARAQGPVNPYSRFDDS